MSLMSPRRFWQRAEVHEAEGGHTVHLDNRPLRTPYKSALILPTRTLAEALAAEWEAVEDKVDPETMPITRRANSAIDKVATQHADVATMLAEYAGTDLICYRAETPHELAARQAAAWDRWLAWAEARHDAPLVPVIGVIHRPQPSQSLARLAAAVAAHDAFALTALHDMITLTGSCVLGLAISDGQITADEAWTLSRIDEVWQAEQWGRDDEAEAAAAIKQDALRDADRFMKLAKRNT